MTLNVLECCAISQAGWFAGIFAKSGRVCQPAHWWDGCPLHTHRSLTIVFMSQWHRRRRGTRCLWRWLTSLQKSCQVSKTRRRYSIRFLIVKKWICNGSFESSSKVRCILIRGEGPAFSAGHNLKEMTEVEGKDYHKMIFDRLVKQNNHNQVFLSECSLPVFHFKSII